MPALISMLKSALHGRDVDDKLSEAICVYQFFCSS